MPEKGGEAPLDAAQAAASELSAATDELNSAIARAEGALARLKLGISAEVMIHLDYEDGDYTALAFQKLGGVWRLCWLEGNGHAPPGHEDQRPLVDASREERLQAVSKLDDLFAALVANARSSTMSVREHVAAVDSFVNRITRKA